MFGKKRCSWIFDKIHKKTPVPESQSCSVRPATLLKKRLWHRRFPVNFVKFLRTHFLQNTSGRRLLNKNGRFLTVTINTICLEIMTYMTGSCGVDDNDNDDFFFVNHLSKGIASRTRFGLGQYRSFDSVDI